MVMGRVPFAFGIGFAAVWAGCGARTVGWGMSCCCPSRRRSTESLLCFALSAIFSSGRYRYRPRENSRRVLGTVSIPSVPVDLYELQCNWGSVELRSGIPLELHLHAGSC